MPMISSAPSRSLTHAKTELIVALDYQHPKEAMDLVACLQELPLIYKVGLELFIAGGPEVIREVIHQGCRVFLDLKLHDIPNTVAKAAKQAALLHVEMFTVHLVGGKNMIQAAAKELAEIPSLRPKILGVSVLTSFDDVHWAEVTRAINGHAVDVGESVQGLVSYVNGYGIDGVVCSAHELALVRKNFPNLYTVVPGIRPEGAANQDQIRVMTPRQAQQLGANAIVVGRPITQASDPRLAAEGILKELV